MEEILQFAQAVVNPLRQFKRRLLVEASVAGRRCLVKVGKGIVGSAETLRTLLKLLKKFHSH